MARKEIVFDPPVAGGIVAGFDGSAASLQAVTVAADEALARDVELHVVRAWMFSSSAREAGAPHGTVPSLDEVEAAVRASVERTVVTVRAGRPGLRATAHAMHGKAADVLLAASQDALVVVVSRRGEGGLVDKLLGSTADQVVRQALSSVLVVRA